MYDGSAIYGHKAFYFSYSLAELVDTDPVNSKNNVLLKVLDFFEILPENYILANFIADKKVGGPPLNINFTDISLTDPAIPYYHGNGILIMMEPSTPMIRIRNGHTMMEVLMM